VKQREQDYMTLQQMKKWYVECLKEVGRFITDSCLPPGMTT
jgi:hypothetical protein